MKPQRLRVPAASATRLNRVCESLADPDTHRSSQAPKADGDAAVQSDVDAAELLVFGVVRWFGILGRLGLGALDILADEVQRLLT